MDAVGRSHQALDFDEPPMDPYPTHEDAADEAVARMAGPGKAP